MSEAVADKHGDPKLFGTIETSKSIIEIPITDNNLSELNKRSHGGEGGEDAEDDADREERHRKKKKKVCNCTSQFLLLFRTILSL